MDEQQWVWERTADGSARFVLGTVGLNPLVCFGINPSTAVPNALDRTVARVSRFAADNGYDSWTMLNVYPQISTDPKGIHQKYHPELKAENERQIMKAIASCRLGRSRRVQGVSAHFASGHRAAHSGCRL